MRLPDPIQSLARAHLKPAPRHLFHSHLSRRAFLRGTAGAAGGVLGARVLGSLPARAAVPGSGTPKPIPGGIVPVPGGPTFHVFLPGPGAEPSLITDLNGLTGVAVVQGQWTATGSPTGGVSSGVWEADQRFMKGLFIGDDGLRRQGTFAFT
jgi:hypothetical protein